MDTDLIQVTQFTRTECTLQLRLAATHSRSSTQLQPSSLFPPLASKGDCGAQTAVALTVMFLYTHIPPPPSQADSLLSPRHQGPYMKYVRTGRVGGGKELADFAKEQY